MKSYCHTPSEKRLIGEFVRHKFPDGVIPIHALSGVMTIHPGFPCEEEALRKLWESLPNQNALPDWDLMRLLLPHTFRVPLTLQHHGAMVHLSSGDMHVHPWGITPEVELEMWQHILARIQDCQYPYYVSLKPEHDKYVNWLPLWCVEQVKEESS